MTEKQEIERIKKMRRKIITAIAVVRKSNKPLEKKADAIAELMMLDAELDVIEKALIQK